MSIVPSPRLFIIGITTLPKDPRLDELLLSIIHQSLARRAVLNTAFPAITKEQYGRYSPRAHLKWVRDLLAAGYQSGDWLAGMPMATALDTVRWRGVHELARASYGQSGAMTFVWHQLVCDGSVAAAAQSHRCEASTSRLKAHINVGHLEASLAWHANYNGDWLAGDPLHYPASPQKILIASHNSIINHSAYKEKKKKPLVLTLP